MIRAAALSLQITQGPERETIEFLIDGNTEMERKLHLGSPATVEYRSVNGNSVAMQVVVAPAAGLKRGELKGRTDSFESAK